MRRRFGVTRVRFSRDLPDDQSADVLAAIPWLGAPRTLGIEPLARFFPARWRRQRLPLPALPEAFDPVTLYRPDGLYWMDRDGVRRVSKPLTPEDPTDAPSPA